MKNPKSYNITVQTKATSASQSAQAKEMPKQVNWDKLFGATPLSVFEMSTGSGTKDYDYEFMIGHTRLRVLVGDTVRKVASLEFSQSALNKIKQKVATSIIQKYQRLEHKRLSNKEQARDETDVSTTFYLGLTHITLMNNGKPYPIEHEYGASFFQELCVLDLDDEAQVLQLFNAGAFVKIMSTLQTPSDFLAFLQFHRYALTNQEDFSTETQVVNQFLMHPSFFERAIAVQKQLVEIGLLQNVEARLTATQQAVTSQNIANDRVSLMKSLQSHSQMFQKLLNGTTKRRHNSGDTLPVEQVRLLVGESMYTRSGIIEEIKAYGNRTDDEKRRGYLRHQHSYNNFGVHYVIVVYGVADDAEFSQLDVREKASQILMDINAQLQDPVMSDYFLLGFDMSNNDGNGNVTVQMDIFHQEGAKMTEMEKRLYAQLKALSPS